ncbi:MAG TPA: ABATE domain-containing protein [Pyrinomonadaceae bacterium]|nr:ABATE domain-containing protein [Pyrinomonadaceae bacterium]
MKGLKSSAAEMRLIGGRLCLDFVNTVDGRKNNSSQRKSQPLNSLVVGDKLEDYSDLVAWSQHSGIVTAAEAARSIKESKQKPSSANAVLRRAIALREALHRIFKATMMKSMPRSIDLEIVNDELLKARKNERLISTDEGFRWKWIGGKTALDRMLWSIAQSAAEFLSAGDLSRLRECGGEECGWLFEDTSRNRSRQWCHMQDCGNLAKIRRFRTRLRSSSKTHRPLTRNGPSRR